MRAFLKRALYRLLRNTPDAPHLSLAPSSPLVKEEEEEIKADWKDVLHNNVRSKPSLANLHCAKTDHNLPRIRLNRFAKSTLGSGSSSEQIGDRS